MGGTGDELESSYWDGGVGVKNGTHENFRTTSVDCKKPPFNIKIHCILDRIGNLLHDMHYTIFYKKHVYNKHKAEMGQTLRKI